MISSLSRRSAAGLALVVCGAAATTCGAPSHTFYDDTNSVAATGTGGAGGTDATSGAAGSSSTGSVGSLTGSGGSMDTTGVGSSTGGSGGEASTGAAGSVGTAGGTGSGGAGGNTTGSAGAAGMGGKSDGGATGGAAGSGGGKADAGPENCFDNIDNNGDTLIDCADPLCAPVGTCVTEEPNHALGVLVDAAAPCPAGTTPTAINRGITGGACTGCTCTPVAMTCSADVFTYDTAAQCSGDVNNVGGTNVGRLTGPCVQTTTQPIFQGNKAGVRVALNAGPAQCSRGGTPSLAPPTWTSSKKLCAYPSRGGGCVAGKRCVPVQTDAATQCSLAAGATATCSGFGTTQNDWYSSFTDTRSCGACGCVAMGGACQNARVQFGSDYVCTDSLVTVNAGAKSCTGTSYSPPAGFLFTAVNPTCTASAMVNGALTPTGPQTLCCTPR